MQLLQKLLFGFILFIVAIFILAIGTRFRTDLKETQSNLDVIVTVKNMEGYFAVNLDSETIQSFSGSSIPINGGTIESTIRLKSPKQDLYAYSYGIIDADGNHVISARIGSIRQGFWTEDGRYFVGRGAHIYRALGLFLPRAIGIYTIYIFEPSTHKSKQLIFYDTNGRMMEITEILGFNRRLD